MGSRLGMNLSAPNSVAGHQAIEVVTERTVSAEGFLVEQAFDAATQANLVGVILEANRPTHPAMPAAA
jgi:hypothetical protein